MVEHPIVRVPPGTAIVLHDPAAYRKRWDEERCWERWSPGDKYFQRTPIPIRLVLYAPSYILE